MLRTLLLLTLLTAGCNGASPAEPELSPAAPAPPEAPSLPEEVPPPAADPVSPAEEILPNPPDPPLPMGEGAPTPPASTALEAVACESDEDCPHLSCGPCRSGQTVTRRSVIINCRRNPCPESSAVCREGTCVVR